MKFGRNSINSILDKLGKREFPYDHTIIIGDNASGKSLLLNMLVKNQKKQTEVYFIDAVNRGFDAAKVSSGCERPAYKGTIVDMRLKEDYFNLKDSFSCYGTSTERVEQIYGAYEEKVQKLFEKLTGERFRIMYGNNLGEVQYPEGTGLLSSGYQAMVRLLLELLYYQEEGIQKRNLKHTGVVIDELDEFLSPRYAAQILPFFIENFPEAYFVVTTHSMDLVMGARDANLVILDEQGFEVMDVNDYNSYSEVQTIFMRVFGRGEEPETAIEELMRRLLNNRINNAWTEEDEDRMKDLSKKKLTASQQLIYRQIKDWI